MSGRMKGSVAKSVRISTEALKQRPRKAGEKIDCCLSGWLRPPFLARYARSCDTKSQEDFVTEPDFNLIHPGGMFGSVIKDNFVRVIPQKRLPISLFAPCYLLLASSHL